MKKLFAAVAATLLLSAGAAEAHHSFAAFFDPTKLITIEGTVTQFRFTNPHGTIALDVKGKGGKIEHWRVETNAPVVLVRRGWSRDILKAGDWVKIEGWPSRDGKPYMRLRQAFGADGRVIGSAPFGQGDS